MRLPLLIVVLAPLLLGGCVARAAWDVATAPVKVVGQAADWATTSQDEADRNRGRADRKAEEKAAKEARKARKQAEKCRRDPNDCD